MQVDSSGWNALPGRLWFLLKTLPVRGRFLTGKASFVRARVASTENAMAQLFDRRGRPLGQKLLAHHRLETEPPRTGSQGWELFTRRCAAADDPRRPFLRLECAFCGHHFLVAVDDCSEAACGDCLSVETASYRSTWFALMDSAYQGEPSLSCAHCEQKSVPRLKFL